MNKKQLVEQCLAENPVMVETINDETRELSKEERTEAANAWADMRLEQIAYEEELANQAAVAQAEAEAKATAKGAILDRLGLSADELQTILG
jgi:hypothetical protein